VADRRQRDRARKRAEASAPDGDAPPHEERDGWSSMLLVPVWIGLFMGMWAGLDALFARAPGAFGKIPSLRAGASALAGAREIVSPILGFLLASYAMVLLGALQRWVRGEPSPCEEPDRPPPQRSGVPKALRDESALAQIDRELQRARRAERSGVRRAALAVNDRIMLRMLRRRGYNDDIGCGGIVAILLGATVALPFAAEVLGRALGFELGGPLGAPLWFALVYGGFGLRWAWKWARASEDDGR
jgi:hypothetical protein